MSGDESVRTKILLLETKKNLLYSDFFEIQNLMNSLIGQRIVMTYVHVDENGRREIRVSENDISHLGISEGMSWKQQPFHKLTYDVANHYNILKNSLPQEENETLQQTAMEVEKRYLEHKKKILWFYPDIWKGFKLNSKGPINEAYVNLYIHNIKLLGTLEGNIDIFMLGEYGAIRADSTKGFMIGDVSRDGIQYAVKGAFGSPQGITEVAKSLEKIQQEDFSRASYEAFIKHYTKEELDKEYQPHIKKLSKQSIAQLSRYMNINNK